MNHFAATDRLWQLPGPPSSTLPSNHISNTIYNPNTYGPMPSAQQPTAVQQPQDVVSGRRPGESTWEESYGYGNIEETTDASKPPLPVGCALNFNSECSMTDLFGCHSPGHMLQHPKRAAQLAQMIYFPTVQRRARSSIFRPPLTARRITDLPRIPRLHPRLRRLLAGCHPDLRQKYLLIIRPRRRTYLNTIILATARDRI